VSLVFSGPAAFIFSGLVTPLAAPEDIGTGSDHTDSIGELWKAASPMFGQLLVGGLIYAVATTVGDMLLIVPGLILVTIWAVAPARRPAPLSAPGSGSSSPPR